MYLNILMTVAVVYIMLLPFLMIYFMSFIRTPDNTKMSIEIPKIKKPKSPKKREADKKRREEAEKNERRIKTLEANIDRYDGTSCGQIPIEE